MEWSLGMEPAFSPDWLRSKTVLDELRNRHPESKGLLDELDDLMGSISNDGEAWGVRRHGEQILQAIRGERYQSQGCSPRSVETPADAELLLVRQ